MEKKSFVASVVITLVVIVLLILSGPVSAVQVRVRPDKNSYNSNDIAVLTVSVDIESNERIPVQNLTLRITNSTSSLVKQCSFHLNGSPIAGCSDIIAIEVLNSAGYGYGSSMYGFGFGYGYGGWSEANQSFGYGYGHAYTDGYAGYSGELSFNITWNLSAEGLSSGNFSADLWAYASDTQGHFRIYSDDDLDDNTLMVDTSIPSSSASSESYDNSGNMTISYSSSETGSGLQYVQLWYRKNIGTWTNTGLTKSTSSGSFSFAGTGDGVYSFYTRATDIAGNIESAPSSADTNVTYDTLRPSSLATCSPYDNSGNISVSYASSDNLSGVANISLWYQTSGSWTSTGLVRTAASGSFSYAPSGNAVYRFYTLSYDNAGNLESKSVADCNTTYDTARPVSTVSSPDYNNSVFLVRFSASDSLAGIRWLRLEWQNASNWIVLNSTNSTTSSSYRFTPSQDGNYAFRSVSRDRAGNLENKTVADSTTVVDTVAPNVTASISRTDEESLRRITVSTTENCTCYYGTGSFSVMATTGFMSHSQTVNLSDGTHTIQIRCYDRATNSRSTSVTATVEIVETSHGGGFSSLPILQTLLASQEHTWQSLAAGQTVTMSMGKPGLALQVLSLMNTEPTQNAQIRVSRILRPTGIELPETVYEYFEISASNMEAKNIRLEFRVNRTWIERHGFKEGDISLYRYSGSWQMLETSFLRTDAKFAYYRALTPGFSTFAIGQKPTSKPREPEQPVEIAEPVAQVIAPVETPVSEPTDIKKEPLAMWILPVVILSLLVVGTLVAVQIHSKNTNQEAIELAIQWIRRAHQKGLSNLGMLDEMLRYGWPKELTQKLIRRWSGSDSPVPKEAKARK